MKTNTFDTNRIQSILSELKNDSVIGNYNLSVDLKDPEIPFLVWNNPQDDEQTSSYPESASHGVPLDLSLCYIFTCISLHLYRRGVPRKRYSVFTGSFQCHL